MTSEQVHREPVGQQRVAIVEGNATLVYGHDHICDVARRERMALFVCCHVASGGEGHLTILQMEARVRKLVEPANMVVVQMRQDHVRRDGGINADQVEAVGRTTHEPTLATRRIVGTEPSVDYPGLAVTHDGPHEVVHGHRGVVRVAADEMIGSTCITFGVLDREDVIRRRVAHRRRVPNMDESLFEVGIEARSRVIGSEYVTKAFSTADTFSREFQEMVTEYCWGGVWGRTALTDRQRSLHNLCILASLNRGTEFKLHFKGALKNGCTLDELRDTLIQIMVYAGVPAGVEAFRLAREVLDAEGITPPPTDKPMPNIPGT